MLMKCKQGAQMFDIFMTTLRAGRRESAAVGVLR
jgi:hypothetical protein